MGASNWWLADHIGDKNGWDNVQKLSYYTALEEQDGETGFLPPRQIYKGQRRNGILIALAVVGCVALFGVLGYCLGVVIFG